MQLSVTLTKEDLQRLVLEHLKTVCDFPLKPEDVLITTRSKQNWKSEWEEADFRATVNKSDK